MTTITPAGLTIADLARRWRISRDKIRSFVRRGELVAVNLATTLSGRPQWRVTPESVEKFERRRTSAPPPKPPRRKKRADLIDFFPD
jgi:hypothetical protein